MLATIHVDTDLEIEQNDAAIQTSLLLIQGLRHNGDISKQTEDRAVGNFNGNLKELDKKLEVEYRKELEVVYTDLSAKNKVRGERVCGSRRKGSDPRGWTWSTGIRWSTQTSVLNTR